MYDFGLTPDRPWRLPGRISRDGCTNRVTERHILSVNNADRGEKTRWRDIPAWVTRRETRENPGIAGQEPHRHGGQSTGITVGHLGNTCGFAGGLWGQLVSDKTRVNPSSPALPLLRPIWWIARANQSNEKYDIIKTSASRTFVKKDHAAICGVGYLPQSKYLHPTAH